MYWKVPQKRGFSSVTVGLWESPLHSHLCDWGHKAVSMWNSFKAVSFRGCASTLVWCLMLNALVCLREWIPKPLQCLLLNHKQVPRHTELWATGESGCRVWIHRGKRWFFSIYRDKYGKLYHVCYLKESFTSSEWVIFRSWKHEGVMSSDGGVLDWDGGVGLCLENGDMESVVGWLLDRAPCAGGKDSKSAVAMLRLWELLWLDPPISCQVLWTKGEMMGRHSVGMHSTGWGRHPLETGGLVPLLNRIVDFGVVGCGEAIYVQWNICCKAVMSNSHSWSCENLLLNVFAMVFWCPGRYTAKMLMSCWIQQFHNFTASEHRDCDLAPPCLLM